MSKARWLWMVGSAGVVSVGVGRAAAETGRVLGGSSLFWECGPASLRLPQGVCRAEIAEHGTIAWDEVKADLGLA